MHRFGRPRVVCPLVVLLYAVVTLPAAAADRFWITSTGGTFGTPGVASANWSAANGGAGGATVPGAADIANFTLNNTYDVAFAAAVTNTDLDIENGNVTFDLNGVTYTVTSASAITLGLVAGQTGRLTVTEGTLAVDTSSDDVNIAAAADSTAFLTVGADGQVGSGATRPQVVVGNNGAGTLTVQGNGELFATSFTVSNFDGSTGTVNVAGPLASVDASSTVSVGNSGVGTMTVSGGANFAGAGTSTIGNISGSAGTLTITGVGSEWTQSTDMIVGSSGMGTLNVQSSGSLTTGLAIIGNGGGSFGTASVSGAGSEWTITDTSSIGISGEGVLNVSSGGHVSATNGLILGSNAAGQASVNVSGAGSRLDVDGSIIASNNGTSAMTISGGGQVTCTDANVALGVGTAEATVTGVGSSWNLSGSLAVALTGAGTVTVENGANLSVLDTITLNDPGGAQFFATLNFRGGTISAANLTRDPGAVLNWTDGTLSIVGGTFDNAGAALVLNGADADDRPTLRLTSGSSTSPVEVGSLTVGDNRSAALELTGGSTLQVPQLNIAATDGGDGIVTVSGAGSSLQSTGNIDSNCKRLNAIIDSTTYWKLILS